MRRRVQSYKRKAQSGYRKGHKFSHHEMEEFGLGKSDIVICPICSAVYYYKSWHHNLLHYPYISEDKKVAFKECPACSMWARRQWEGEVCLIGIPNEKKEQIKNTILSVADEAYRRDPMHRVFDIKKARKQIIIYTSENQLARRIARKISSAFKKHFSKPEFHYGEGEDVLLIKMKWLT